MLGATIVVIMLTKSGQEKIVVDHFPTVSECKVAEQIIKQEGFLKLNNGIIHFDKVEIHCIKDKK